MRFGLLIASAVAAMSCPASNANASARPYSDELAIYPVVLSPGYLDVLGVLGDAYLALDGSLTVTGSGVHPPIPLTVAELAADGRLHFLRLNYPKVCSALQDWAKEHSLPSPVDTPYRLPEPLIKDPRAQDCLCFPVLLYEAGTDEAIAIFMLADGRREQLPEPKTYIHASRFLLVNSVDSRAVRRLLREPPTRYQALKSHWLWQWESGVTTGVTARGDHVRRRFFAGWAQVSCPGEQALLADYFQDLLASHQRDSCYGYASAGPFFPEQECWFTPSDGADAFEIDIQWADRRFRGIGVEDVIHEVVTWDTTDFALFDTLDGDSVMLIFEGSEEHGTGPTNR
jgi:hypothetical protein